MPDSTRCVALDGTVHYYNSKGQLHREDGPAIEYCKSELGGGNRWFFNGKKHRIDGPAVTHADGTTEWWLDGQRHRIDGPAFEHPDKNMWFYKGKQIYCDNLKEFHRLIKLGAFW